LITSRERYEDSLTRTSVGGRIRGLLEDTADVVLTDLDVTLLSPGWAPRVLDEEVVLTVLSTIADSKDTMIERGTASVSGDDTSLVTLEGNLIGLNSNRDGALHEGSHKLSLLTVLNIVISGGTNDTLILLVSAAEEAMRLGNVRIVRFGLERVGLGVGEGSVHHTTVAAHVQPGAVNQLLLGEGDEVTGLDLVSALEGTSGGERPAGSALTLVLDGGDSSLGNPVDLISEVGVIKLDSLVLSLDIIDGFVTEELFSFFLGPVGHVVDANSMGVGRVVVVSFNLLKVLGEEIESEFVLSSVGIDFVVLSDEREEFVLRG
jgi:hypothetical protein